MLSIRDDRFSVHLCRMIGSGVQVAVIWKLQKVTLFNRLHDCCTIYWNHSHSLSINQSLSIFLMASTTLLNSMEKVIKFHKKKFKKEKTTNFQVSTNYTDIQPNEGKTMRYSVLNRLDFKSQHHVSLNEQYNILLSVLLICTVCCNKLAWGSIYFCHFFLSIQSILLNHNIKLNKW